MASQEINNCEFNTELGMRYYGRPTTFCTDLYVGGNLYVGGSIEEGGSPAASGPGEVSAGPCFEQIKVTGGFLVEGDACFKESINLEKDILIGGTLASTKVRVFEDCKIDKSLCVGGSAKVNAKMEVTEDLKVTGRFIVGDGDVDCENPDISEAKAVCDGTLLVTDVVYAPATVISGTAFSEEVVSESVKTKKLEVNGYVYRERTIEVTDNGVPTLLTVLVREEEGDTPDRPEKVKSCPVQVPCVDVSPPAPPCPSIDC